MNRTRKLIRYVGPSMLSSLSIFLYTIVDGIFLGRGVGTEALGAVNLAFPYFMLFNALVLLTTMGGMTIVAVCVGKGDREGANAAYTVSLLMSAGLSIIMFLPAVLMPGTLVRLMGAEGGFVEPAAEYLFYLGLFLIPNGMNVCLMGFARNDGAPVLVSAATVISCGLNIFGDWLTVFPLHMGLKGAALASGVSQSVSVLIVLTHFLLKKGQLRIKRRITERNLMKLILRRGLPECVSQFCVPVTTILTNIMLAKLTGDAGVKAYSILCYAACFSAAAFCGAAEGLQPLFGNCWGAGEMKDLRYFLKAGLMIGFFGSLLITGVLLWLWGGICTLFAVDDVTRAACTRAMPRFSWGFSVQALNVIISAYLYSTTRTREALVINVLRSFAADTAVILLLPLLLGAESIWYTFGIYETLVLFVSAVLLFHAEKRRGAVLQAD